MLQTPLLRVLAALLTSATLSCLESAAEQLVLGLGCGKRGIWLGEWIGLKRCQTWKAGGLSRMNTRDCFSSSAVHNTHANFSRWGLEGESQEDGKRSVGFLWFLWDLCLLITPYEKAGREIPSVVPDTGLLKSAATREENTWEWGIFFFFLTAHLSQCDPKQKALALIQNDLFPCCQNARFCWCYVLLHDSFKAGMIVNSFPQYLIARVAGCWVGLTHHKHRCLGKYCLFLLWISTRADHFVNWCALMREEGAVCYFAVILEYLFFLIVLLLWDSGPYSANNPAILNS